MNQQNDLDYIQQQMNQNQPITFQQFIDCISNQQYLQTQSNNQKLDTIFQILIYINQNNIIQLFTNKDQLIQLQQVVSYDSSISQSIQVLIDTLNQQDLEQQFVQCCQKQFILQTSLLFLSFIQLDQQKQQLYIDQLQDILLSITIYRFEYELIYLINLYIQSTFNRKIQINGIIPQNLNGDTIQIYFVDLNKRFSFYHNSFCQILEKFYPEFISSCKNEIKTILYEDFTTYQYIQYNTRLKSLLMDLFTINLAYSWWLKQDKSKKLFEQLLKQIQFSVSKKTEKSEEIIRVLTQDKDNLKEIIKELDLATRQKLMSYNEISDLLEKDETLLEQKSYFANGILELVQNIKQFGFVIKINYRAEAALTFMFSRKKLFAISFKDDVISISNQNQQLCEIQNNKKQYYITYTNDTKNCFIYINQTMIFQGKNKYSLQSLIFDNITMSQFDIYESCIPYACTYYFEDDRIIQPIYDSPISNLMLKRKHTNGFLLPNYKLKNSEQYIQTDTYLGDTLEELQLYIPDISKFSYQNQADILTYAQIRPQLNERTIHMNNFYVARYLSSVVIHNWLEYHTFFKMDKKCVFNRQINYVPIPEEKHQQKFDLNKYCQEIQKLQSEQYSLRDSSSFIRELQKEDVKFDQVGIFCCTSDYLFCPSQFYTQLTFKVLKDEQLPQFIEQLYIQLCQRINNIVYKDFQDNLIGQRKQIYNTILQSKSIKVAQSVVHFVLSNKNISKDCQLDMWLQFLEDINKIKYCKFMTSNDIPDYYLQYLEQKINQQQENIPQDAISRYFILILMLQNRISPLYYQQFYMEIIESLKIIWISISQDNKNKLQLQENNKYLQCIFNQQQVYLQNLYVLSMLEQNDQQNIIQYLIKSLSQDLDTLTSAMCNLQNLNLLIIYNNIIKDMSQHCRVNQYKIYLDQLLKITISYPQLFEENQQTMIDLSTIQDIDEIAKCFLIYVIYCKQHQKFDEDKINEIYQQLIVLTPHNFTFQQLMQKSKKQLINQSYSVAVYSILLSYYYQYVEFTLMMINLIPTQFVNLKNQISDSTIQEELQDQMIQLLEYQDMQSIENIMNCIQFLLPKYSQHFQILTKFQQTEQLQLFETKKSQLIDYSKKIDISDYLQNKVIKERISNRLYGQYQLQMFYDQVILKENNNEQYVLPEELYLSQILNLKDMIIALQCLYNIKSEINQHNCIFAITQDQIYIILDAVFKYHQNNSLDDALLQLDKQSKIIQLSKKQIQYINSSFIKHRQTGIDIYTRLGYQYTLEIADDFTSQQCIDSDNAEVLRGVLSKFIFDQWQINDNCKYWFTDDILFQDIKIKFYSINKFTLQAPDTFQDEQMTQELKKKLNDSFQNYIKIQQQKILNQLDDYEENKNTNQFLCITNQNSLLYQILLLSGFKECENQNNLKGRQGIFDYIMGLQNSNLIDNLQAIYLINLLASRSSDNIQQDIIYPIINQRNMQLPVQAQYQERFDQIQEKYQQLLQLDKQNQEEPTAQQILKCTSFQNGSFCSCGANSVYYAIRIQPYTSAHIDLQGGHFDNPNRLFFNINQLSFKQYENGFKELTPICFLSQNYLNLYNQDMGQNDDKIQINDLIYQQYQQNYVKTNIQIKKKLLSQIQDKIQNQSTDYQESSPIIIQQQINNPIGLSYQLISSINKLDINQLLQWLCLFYGVKRNDKNICNQYMQQCYITVISDEHSIRSQIDQIRYFGVMPEQIFKVCTVKLLKTGEQLLKHLEPQIELQEATQLVNENRSQYKIYKDLYRFDIKELIQNCMQSSPYLSYIRQYQLDTLSFKQMFELQTFNIYLRIIHQNCVQIMKSGDEILYRIQYNNRIRNAYIMRSSLVVQFQHEVLIYSIKYFLNNQHLRLKLQQQFTKDKLNAQQLIVLSSTVSNEASILCLILKTEKEQILVYYDLLTDIILRKEDTIADTCKFIANDFLALKQTQNKIIEIKNPEGITFCKYDYSQYQDFNPKISSTRSLYSKEYYIILYHRKRLQFYTFSEHLFNQTMDIDQDKIDIQQPQQDQQSILQYYSYLENLNQQTLQQNKYGAQVNRIEVCSLLLNQKILFNENIVDLTVNIKDIINIQLTNNKVTLLK